MILNDSDKRLVDILQSAFPLTVQPYANIGSTLDISEKEVIATINQLKQEGFIRHIGPIFNPSCLGYKTTLVAIRVNESIMEKATSIIIEHPGISHAYVRDHYYNLWITLAVAVDIEAGLAKLAEAVGAEQYFSLPVVKPFKLRAIFNIGADSYENNTSQHNQIESQQECRLSSEEKMMINEIQQELPLVSHPFTKMSAKLGLYENEFLSRCISLLQRHIMRRFGATVNHRKVGFTTNAMACWSVPGDKVNDLGKRLTQRRQVSHCYERKTNPLWPYNIFAMIHSHSKAECRKAVENVSLETGITDYIMLFSTREIKKKRIKYPV